MATILFEIDSVGRVVNMRPIGNRRVSDSEFIYGPIANRPQINNLPHEITNQVI